MNVTFLPSIVHTVDIVAAFDAGPAIKNTRAAPGDKPLSIKAAAIGTDEVEHTYIGMLISTIISIVPIPEEWYLTKKSAGIKAVINPAAKTPTKRDPPMSLG